MNKQESQYYQYLKNLGYTVTYHDGKSSFTLKENNFYLKVCEFPAPKEVVEMAIKHSLNRTIVLLDGNLTFKGHRMFSGEEEIDQDVFLTYNGSKYGDIFYGEFDVDCFSPEAKAIADAINETDIICQRCKSVNNYSITKQLHYKANCNVCKSFIKNLGTNKPIVLHFGKYLGRELLSMQSKEEMQYLQWGYDNNIFSKKINDAVKQILGL